MDENRIPNFSGDTNPFMSCLDSHGNYKKVIYKIPVGDLSEKDAIKHLRELREIYKLTPESNKNYFIPIKNENQMKANYMHVVPNSHFWTDLNQIVYSIEHELDRQKYESEKHDGEEYKVKYIGEHLTKDYILIGLGNSLTHGYKLKPTFKEDIKVRSGKTPIFESIKQMIEYVESDNFSLEMFKEIISQTINTEINLTNGMKMQRSDVYKRLDGERDYQDERWGTRRTLDGTPDEEKPVAEWINYMEFHLAKAKEKVYYLKTEEALAEVRKVTALGVRAMEIHGCPERIIPVDPPKTESSDNKCECKKE